MLRRSPLRYKKLYFSFSSDKFSKKHQLQLLFCYLSARFWLFADFRTDSWQLAQTGNRLAWTLFRCWLWKYTTKARFLMISVTLMMTMMQQGSKLNLVVPKRSSGLSTMIRRNFHLLLEASLFHNVKHIPISAHFHKFSFRILFLLRFILSNSKSQSKVRNGAESLYGCFKKCVDTSR